MAGPADGPKQRLHYQFISGDRTTADRRRHRRRGAATWCTGPIEHAATASWSSDGRLTVWTCTQGAFTVRDQCIAILGVPVSKIRVIPTEIGFGGRPSCTWSRGVCRSAPAAP
jgi:hypothetical protein